MANMQTRLIIRRHAFGFGFTPPARVPIAALVLGRPVAEAAAVLPRVFNLCRGAQTLAVRLALGLEARDPSGAAMQALQAEILQDHLANLWVIWPKLLGLPVLPLRKDVWGGEAPTDLARWMASGRGVAPVLAAIEQGFAPDEAVASLPLPRPETALIECAQENSVAARHEQHSLMQQVETAYGRGPLWHGLARVLDVEACLTGALPAPQVLADGTAIVAAARGGYALRARAVAGMVTSFERRTPTDHLCAPNGALAQALATLPAQKYHLAPVVVGILSPCVPVQFQEVTDA